MIEPRAPACVDLIGITKLAAHCLEQTALETAAENVRHYVQGWIIFVAHRTAEVSDREHRLRDIGFGCDINAWRSGVIYPWERRHHRLLHRPPGKSFLNLCTHFAGFEIALDRK